MDVSKENFKAFLEKEKKFLQTVSLEKILPLAGWLKLDKQITGDKAFTEATKWARKGEVVFARKDSFGHWGYVKEGNAQNVYPGWELFKHNAATVGPDSHRKQSSELQQETLRETPLIHSKTGRTTITYTGMDENSSDIKKAYIEAMSKFRNYAVVADRELAVKFYSQFKKETNIVFGKKPNTEVNVSVASEQKAMPSVSVNTGKEKSAEVVQAPVLHKKIIDNVSLFKVAVALGFSPKEYSSGSGVLSANDKKEIISQSDIVDVIERFVPERLVFREGFYYTPSPFSQSGEGELKVSRSKKFFFCEDSKKTGNAATYLVEARGMDEKEAYKWLAHTFSVKLQTEKLRVYYEKGKSILSIDRVDSGAFVFFDHNTEKGGTVFELISRELNCDRIGTIEWLYKNAERIVPEEKLNSFRAQLSEEMVHSKSQISAKSQHNTNQVSVEESPALQEKATQGISM